MVRSRGFQGARRSPSIPKGRSWAVGVGGGDRVALAAGTQIVGGGINPTANSLTLMRMRGRLALYRTAVAAAVTDRQRITMGMGRFSLDAFILGAAGLPEPSSDISFPWLWWDTFWIEARSTGATRAPEIQDIIALNEAVDIKAMRKFTIDEVLALVVEVHDVTGTLVPVSMAFDSRALVQWAGA